MKPKTLVLMGVAIACGLGASYMTSRLLAERQTEDEPKVSVLVARKNLNLGDTIKVPEELFQEKKFTKGEEPPGAIDNPELIKNRVLKRPLRPGDHVTMEDLINGSEGEGMSIVLPGGYRAVGVRVNVESAAFGFACLPLSRVDLVSTVRRADDKATYSQVLLENVLVLAADDKMRRDESGKPMPSQVVTLALKPEDALKVALASELGSIRLLLRKVNDVTRASDTKLTYEKLKSGENDLTNDDVVTEVPKAPVEYKSAETPKAPAEPKAPAAEVKPPTPEPKVVAEVKPPVAEPKPVVEDKPPQVVDEKPKAPVGKLHRITVVDGGRTRYIDYLLDENGQVIDATGEPGDVHPPRPADVIDPKEPKTK